MLTTCPWSTIYIWCVLEFSEALHPFAFINKKAFYIMVSILFNVATILLLNISSCLCLALVSNTTFKQRKFEPALATWYGDETGAGSGNEKKYYKATWNVIKKKKKNLQYVVFNVYMLTKLD